VREVKPGILHGHVLRVHKNIIASRAFESETLTSAVLSLLDLISDVKYTYHVEHEAVGNNLKEHRARLGLTQAQLAELTGVSRISIVSIENGRFIPTIETALRIGRALGVPAGEIFWLKDGEK